MPELTDNLLTALMADVANMTTPSFFPANARAAGEPYIERHHIAYNESVYTVWHASVPVAPNLDASYKATDEYLDQLDVAGLTYPTPSQARASTTNPPT